ncbi:putative lipid II flippase FtsW [Aquibacillus salsiterrae]|uniref:Probable peptidoglycan glycosyltransferase FtsW n=1 Tax=Aquibacillus salsiterrae TaxID=2950439 RepID=A0A9X3WBX1_9BACI|nr:putative lipid II flippase FtsW [Aquibacillus salsiterrae]MDC3416517.1 putative lipid II flippase FtsW [Aquibacillus salsiterrae]
MKQKWKTFDFTLVFVPLLLAAFGLVMIYSASMVTSVVVYDVPSNFFLLQQFRWYIIGIIGFIFCSFFSYQRYQDIMKFIIIAMTVMLILVLFVGKEVNNAQSWLSFGGIQVQPAELVKLGIVLYLASVYSKKQDYISDFMKGVLPPLVVTMFLLGLIVLQPDVGTAAIIFLIACSVIFSSGIKFRHLSLLIITGIIMVGLAATQMVTKERLERFTGAYQPFLDPEDSGYHLIQSYIAIGSGGLTGEGLGQGVQKLGYLTEPHTDFIMAVIAEELGFFGVVLVLGMLATIVLRGLYISRRCKDSFGSLLAIGISSMIGIQAFINLGAISGLLPITGVPLPFVSYGGSSLFILLLSVGILNNIARHVKVREKENAVKKSDIDTKGSAISVAQAKLRGGKTIN